MTTGRRPNVRIDIEDVVADAEVADEVNDASLTKKGTKRKRAPPTKGPCEHGLKYRSRCKVCSACSHGRRRSKCKECGGASICEHGRERSKCNDCTPMKKCIQCPDLTRNKSGLCTSCNKERKAKA